MVERDYPEWPEHWEFFDGILKYDPHDSDDLGGESDFEGIPHRNSLWIVVHGGIEPPPDRLHKKKPRAKRRRKKWRGRK